MVDFNVAAHLGIVGKQLEIVEDNCRDSSNPDPKQNRDSWGQLNTESFLGDTKQLSQSFKEDIFSEKSLGAQRSTTISNLVSERDPTIVNLSPTVSTPSTPNPALMISHLPDTSIAEKTDALASTPVMPSAAPTSKNGVQWFAPETLQDIAKSLSRCKSAVDINCLYQIWDRSSIKAACSLLTPETRTKIQEWIVVLEAPDQIELI